MNTLELETSALSSDWKQIEKELLTHVREAEVEFEQALDHQKEQAGEKYRQALARFSALILDRRFPPGFQFQP
jgi:hypothetical protein